ncbi:MAG: hypothetical protein AABX29_00475 [Nanoarchaeota archaeon]
MTQKEFILRKSKVGALTIEDRIIKPYFSIGFLSPNSDGRELHKFMKKLKDGDKIVLKKATADNSDFKTASPKLKHS